MSNKPGEQLAGLKQGDHLCPISESEAESWNAVVLFMKQGLARAERCLYVANDHTEEEVIRALTAGGVDVAGERDRGALQLLNLREQLPPERAFDPQAVVGYLRKAEAQALAAGFSGVRVTGESTWLLERMISLDQLVEYEAVLTQYVVNSRCVLLCQYDTARLHPVFSHEIVRCHPTALIGDMAYPNPYYEPPELVLGEKALSDVEFKARQVRWWITQLERARAVEQERWRAEEALRVSEERFRTTFVRAAVGMALMTPEGRFQQVNDAYCAMTGYTKAEVLAMSYRDVTHPEDLGFFKELLGQLLNDEIPSFVTEKRYINKGGRVSWHRESVSVVRDQQGRPLDVICLVEDVTSRKVAETELRTNTEKLQALASASLRINAARTPARVAEAVTEAARSILGAHMAITGFTAGEDWAEATPIVSLSEEYATRQGAAGLPDASGIYSLVCQANQPLRLTREALEAHPGWRRLVAETGKHPPGGLLAALLVGTKGEKIGLLAVSGKYEGGFTANDEAMLVQLSQMASVAMENTWLYEQVKAGHERLHVLSQRLLEVQEAERRHLARELHDEVGQMLTGLRFLMKAGGNRDAEAVHSRFEQARGIVDDLLGRIRMLSFDLRPAVLDQLGLLPALLAFFERYTSQTGVAVEFKHSGLEGRFAPEVETPAYRIVQESLTNVARHAGVGGVTVRVWATTDTLSLQVVDRGHGFDPEVTLQAPRSSGLAGMQERVMLLAGRLTIESSPEAGTQIMAELPLPESGGER